MSNAHQMLAQFLLRPINFLFARTRCTKQPIDHAAFTLTLKNLNKSAGGATSSSMDANAAQVETTVSRQLLAVLPDASSLAMKIAEN